ncbi:hypothetical protein M8J77_024418 [Diaphorina citri]|nr:hypothetical protein M8J77_024418 [Diaphorina citri]
MDSGKSFLYIGIFMVLSVDSVLGMIGSEIKKGYWHDYETRPSQEETFQLPDENITKYDFLLNSTEDRILMGGTTADNSFDNIHDTMIPILKKWFGDSLHYIYMRPSHSREKDLDDWGIPQGSQYRPTMVKLFIVSPRFANKTVDEVSSCLKLVRKIFRS